MTRLSKIMFGAAASIAAMSGVALADGTGDPAATTTDPAAASDPAAGTTTGPAVGATSDSSTTDAWPMAIIDRPLTLNAGMIGASASLGVAHLDLGALGSSTTEGLAVGGDYGVSDQLMIGASYGLTLNEFEAKGPLNVRAAYRLAHGQLKVAANAGFKYDFNSEGGDVSLGAQVAYNVAPTFAVYTGGSQLDLGVIRSGMNAPTPITLAVPVGLAVQATPNVYAFAETTVATFSLKDSSNVYISDATPAVIGAYFSPSNKLDVGLAATFLDLQHADTVWGVLATARVFKM